MSETTEITCARHPDTPTRLGCSECATPICPRCAVETAVGQKCPECARQRKAAVRRGKPRQYRRAIAAGLGAGALAAFVLPFVYVNIGFFRAILTGFVGYGIARAVLWGSENNRADPFRNIAMGVALAAAVAGWLIAGLPPARLITFGPVLTYAGAAYGAWIAFNR